MSCITMAGAQTRSWAIGFKIGEPSGLNIRKYGDHNALDITLGTYGGVLAQNKAYRKGNYRTAGFMLNSTYLWYVHWLRERMIAYAGVGGQVNSRNYYPGKSGGGVYLRSVSLGPSATAGLEYLSRAKARSFFLEGGGYVELLPGFLYTSPQVSFGVRFNF
jgi:hypothetical protein